MANALAMTVDGVWDFKCAVERGGKSACVNQFLDRRHG